MAVEATSTSLSKSLNSQLFLSSSSKSCSLKTPFLSFPLNRRSKGYSLTSSTSISNSAADVNTTLARLRVDMLSQSLPYIQKFRGKTIVVKYGGAAMKPNQMDTLLDSVIKDLVLLSAVGLRPVFVHGGFPEIDFWLKRFGIKPVFPDGLPFGANTMKIVSNFLLKKVNMMLVSLINSAGASAANVYGMDYCLSYIPSLLKIGFIPVIAPVAADELLIPVAGDEFGERFKTNADADTVAEELAVALGAEKLILFTEVAGILENQEDPNSLVKEIDVKGVKNMIECGKVGGEMIPKVNCCIRSLAQGVRTASIIDGRVEHSLLLEIMTDEGAGTMITL